MGHFFGRCLFVTTEMIRYRCDRSIMHVKIDASARVEPKSTDSAGTECIISMHRLERAVMEDWKSRTGRRFVSWRYDQCSSSQIVEKGTEGEFTTKSALEACSRGWKCACLSSS